jgi:hypothetical protein
MKLTTPIAKPRNPFVAAAMQRAAGAHRSGCPRQAAQRELQRELSRLRHSP